MKKLAFLLCIAVLFPTLCIFAAASGYGESTQKLIITHINEVAYYEGSGMIFTTSDDGTIKQYGSFDWWNVVSFKWSESDGCYVVAEVNKSSGTAKGATKIPENGFVYCINKGNNWPEIYAQNPTAYEGYKDAPNYTSKKINECYDFVAKLKVGDKAFLYGTDPVNGVISNNGALWYTDDFKSNSYIKIGSAESGANPFNPTNPQEIKPTFMLGINAVNKSVTEGQSMLLTPSYGITINAKNNNYDWCRVAVFDWDAKAEAYVLLSVNTSVGPGMQKNAIIPPNGFAISVNKGNDYSGSGGINYINSTATNMYDNLDKIEIGTKVYLCGIDLKNSSFEYTGDISKYYSSANFTTNGFICVSENKPEDAYTPATAPLLSKPEFVNSEKGYVIGDIELKWNAVDGATKYKIAINNSNVNKNGPTIISKDISETSFILAKDKLNVGTKYTVWVYAMDDNGNTSSVSEYVFKVYSERSQNGLFSDKKVVAFGDSITAWVGWVAMLEGELGCDVYNAGVGGDRTVQALERIDKDVIAQNPDLVIVNFGMNDQAVSGNKNLTPIDQYEENYRTIIEKIQLTGSDIILVAVHDVCNSKYLGGAPTYNKTDADGVTYIDRYNEVVKKLAQEYNLGFLDINTLSQDILPEIILDGIHLNDMGQIKYCEWISDYCYKYYSEIKSNTEDTSSNSENESVVSDELSDIDNSKADDGLSTTQIAIIACVMMVVISVIGVLFVKTIKKNK